MPNGGQPENLAVETADTGAAASYRNLVHRRTAREDESAVVTGSDRASRVAEIARRIET